MERTPDQGMHKKVRATARRSFAKLSSWSDFVNTTTIVVDDSAVSCTQTVFVQISLRRFTNSNMVQEMVGPQDRCDLQCHVHEYRMPVL